MIGMLQILTYMFAFYLVLKGVEILQVGLASARASRGGVIALGVCALLACIIAAAAFVVLQDAQVRALGGSPAASSLVPSANRLESPPSSGYTAPSETEIREREALTDAHNKGWAWAQSNSVTQVNGCSALKDPDERFGCEAFVRAR